MKIYLAVLLLSIQIFSKDLTISGKILDSDTHNPLPSANVLLYHLPDSTMKGTVTDKKGYFKSDNLRSGKYTLVVKFLGYKDYSANVNLDKESVDLGTVLMKPENIKTDEVTVIGKVPIATLSGDTTVFNADAFKVNKGAVAEDLLKKVPGIQLESGKIKAQGEEVKKVYIDGKTYMGDDPNAAIKNLPADVIDKIQVFDQQSEQSQFTGFNDGNTQKAINFITRMNVHTGTFGKLFAGYGTDDRYGTGGNYNSFNEDRRIGLLGQINNTNEQNFSEVDLLGVMGGGGGGGRMFRGRAEDFFATSRSGEVNTKALGINYNDKYFQSLESGTSYMFNNVNSNQVSNLNRLYLNTNDSTIYNEKSGAVNDNFNHRVNMLVNWLIDTMNTIRILPSFSMQKNNSTSVTIGSTGNSTGALNYSNSTNSTDLTGFNLNIPLMMRHRFNNDRRTISLSLNGQYRKNQGNRKLYSESVFYDAVTNSDTLDQLSDINNAGHSLQADLTYTEPVGISSQISINGSYSYSRDRNDKQTSNFEQLTNRYSGFDTSLSNVYTKRYINRSASVGFRTRMSKLNANISISYNIATLKSEQEFPKRFELSKNFYSFQPIVMINYALSRDKSISLWYRTSANAPSATQLQNVVNNSNPLQLTTGNPDLKQEYSHNLSFRLSTQNFNNMSSFFMMLGGNFKQNNIGTTTIMARRDTLLPNGIQLNSGSQLSYPENYNGYMSLQSFMTYGIPIDFISSTVNFNLSGNYTKNPGTLNKIYNVAKTINYGLGATISSNISEELDFTISSTSSLNQVRNTSTKNSDDDYFSQQTTLRFYWLNFERLAFSSDLTHRYVQGLTKPTSFLVNLNLGLKVFGNRKGEIKLSVYDALNQNNNNSKTTTDTYTQEYSSNLIGRYYLLSFVYNISSFN